MKGATFLVAAMAALALATPASAATYQLAGKQTVIDANAGTFKMTGDLRGRWQTTSFEEVALTPFYEAKGTESFTGCIDRRRDRSCAGDPSGTLTFEFRYWGLYGSADPASLVWGACWHPVVSGAGAFAGAQGVVMFVDTPTSRGVTTSYFGNLTLKGSGKKAKASAARRLAC